MLEYHTQHFVSVVRDPRTSWLKIIYHPGLRFLGPFYFVDPCLWSRRWPTCRFYRNINRRRPNIWLHLNISTWKCCLYFSGGIASLHFRDLRGRLHWTDLAFWLNILGFQGFQYGVSIDLVENTVVDNLNCTIYSIVIPEDHSSSYDLLWCQILLYICINCLSD